MTSCILAFYIAAWPLTAGPAAGHPGVQSEAASSSQTPDADALYATRDDLGSARKAESLWQQRLTAHPQDFESAWKLARARYWLGGHAPASERKKILEDGIAAAKTASTLPPDRPEGHFRTAANMGAL